LKQKPNKYLIFKKFYFVKIGLKILSYSRSKRSNG
jgi:hypothetical protein